MGGVAATISVNRVAVIGVDNPKNMSIQSIINMYKIL